MPGINVIIAAIIVALILYFVVKVFLKPIQLLWKLAINSVVGLVLLMIFNYVASYFAFYSDKHHTILICGFLRCSRGIVADCAIPVKWTTTNDNGLIEAGVQSLFIVYYDCLRKFLWT